MNSLVTAPFAEFLACREIFAFVGYSVVYAEFSSFGSAPGS